MKVLIVEDEPKVAKFLEQALQSEGFETQTLNRFELFRDFIETSEAQKMTAAIDVAILDRMMGPRDTKTLFAPFKAAFPGTKVIFLSALSSPEEKAELLDLGADDYLAKPFSLLELLSRLRVQFRRPAPAPQEGMAIQLGDLVIDRVHHEVRCGSAKIDLSNKEFKLLSVLVKDVGRVLSRFQLMDRVWDTQRDLESNVVEATVRNLRRKLEGAQSQVKIQSKRNVGYWIEA